MKHLLIPVAALGAVLLSGCYVGPPPRNPQHTIRGVYFLDTTQTIEISNLGPRVNTAGNDYAPFVNANGRAVYFTSPSKGKDQDLYVGIKKWAGDTLWESVKALPLPINSSLHEGSIAFSADDSVVVFVACNRPGGVGDCDLYTIVEPFSGEPKIGNIRYFNTAYWETGPAISSDGRTIYFVSNRPGTLGGPDDGDIYVCHRKEDGTWSTPENLGSPINTRYREDSPFLAAGDSLLYFASAVPGGIGGRDIYVSSRKSDGTWGTPRNLGRPINTELDEVYFSSTEDGFVHYFCSSRKDILNYGIFDIYMVRFVP